MCRFLLIKSQRLISPLKLLHVFADMAKNSPAPDGDLQGDGWGVSWLENNEWKKYSSLAPVWEDRNRFNLVPQTHMCLVHARSASFATHKGELEFNQPYIQDPYSFVFNGLLKGISFPYPLAGTIGAQKIWSLTQQQIQKSDAQTGLEATVKLLNRHTSHVQALNLGMSDGKSIFAYTQFAENEEYYALRAHISKSLTLICSKPLEGYTFKKLEQKKVHTFP